MNHPVNTNNSIASSDRAAGAVMRALIGDALAVGPHWYYDLDEMHHDYGTGSPFTPTPSRIVTMRG